MELYRTSLRGRFQEFAARKGWQDRWVGVGVGVGDGMGLPSAALSLPRPV